jgi:hypothetical protein
MSLCALLAAASACAAPLQNGSITVGPGAEARLGLMCRYRLDTSDAQQEACTADVAE